MAKPNRAMAYLAYLVPLVGPLLVMVTQRRSPFALYHACQALALLLGAVVVPLVWGLLGWIVAWVPLVGPVLAMAGFSLAIAASIMIAAAWILGLAHVARGRMDPVRHFGGWGDRLFARFTRSTNAPLVVDTVQPAPRP